MVRAIPRVLLLVDLTSAWGCGIMRGIAGYARRHGPWHFFIYGWSPAGYREVPRGWRGDGVIGRVERPALIRRLQHMGVPVVNLRGNQPPNARRAFPQVAVHYQKVGRLAAGHLLDCGLRHLATIGIPPSLPLTEGFAERVQHAGARLHAFPTPPGTSRHPREQQVLRWLVSLPTPVGVLAVDDRVSRMVVQLCAVADRRVPEDVAVLGISNDEMYCHMGYPELSSIDLATERVGQKAAELLDGLMKGQTPPAAPILIDPVRVVVRQSTDMLTIDDDEVAEALRFIRLHATAPITVADVLKQVPISRRSLEYRFERILGRSPAAEIARVQFEHAQYLLADSDLPIESVAIAAGFNSANYLSYLFRRRLNMTPRQYRLQSASTRKRQATPGEGPIMGDRRA